MLSILLNDKVFTNDFILKMNGRKTYLLHLVPCGVNFNPYFYSLKLLLFALEDAKNKHFVLGYSVGHKESYFG